MITEREKMSQRKELGERLRRARTAAGYSQIDVAEAMGEVTRAFVSLVEKGETGVDQHRVTAAAKFLNVDVDWLMFGKGKAPNLKPSEETRRALRPANFSRLGWSNSVNRPPFEGAIALMADKVGIGSASDGGRGDDPRVQDWFRIPAPVLESIGAHTDARKLRIWEVGSNTIPEAPRGSYALVDTSQDEPRDGDLYALDNGVSVVLKRVVDQVGEPSKIGLADGGPAATQQVVPRKRVKFCGKVVAVFSTI